MFLWIALLAGLAFYFGGVRRALRHHQGPRIALDICLGAPVLWSSLQVGAVACAVCVVLGVLGYIHVARGRELPGLWLEEGAFRSRQDANQRPPPDKSAGGH